MFGLDTGITSTPIYQADPPHSQQADSAAGAESLVHPVNSRIDSIADATESVSLIPSNHCPEAKDDHESGLSVLKNEAKLFFAAQIYKRS